MFLEAAPRTVSFGALAMVLLMAERTKKQRSAPQRETAPANDADTAPKSEGADRLKAERSVAQESLDRIKTNLTAKAEITPAKIDQFTHLMRERLRNGDLNARKAWLGSLIHKIEVDDEEIRISGSKDVLSAALSGPMPQHPPVLGFVRKWRALQESNLRPQD